MKNSGVPYCIPDRRELTAAELRLLERLAVDSPELKNHIGRLKVVARCGCGQCPTILFGNSLEDEPITSQRSLPVADWMGRAENGRLVGIGLFALDGRPVELEAWSPGGEEIDGWPPTSSIEWSGD